MDKRDFADTANNMKDLTLGQIFHLITKLKYKTVVMMITFVLTVLGGAFAAGKYSQQKETAVMLESPFSMRIDVGGESHDFENLTLIKDPSSPTMSEDRIVLLLREIKTAFDIVPVGKVIARVEQDKISGLWQLIISQDVVLINEANAQDIKPFDWNGHEKDFKFKEEFVSKTTVHRHYSDGCTLAYEVDTKGRSIPGTFRWVEQTH